MAQGSSDDQHAINMSKCLRIGLGALSGGTALKLGVDHLGPLISGADMNQLSRFSKLVTRFELNKIKKWQSFMKHFRTIFPNADSIPKTISSYINKYNKVFGSNPVGDQKRIKFCKTMKKCCFKRYKYILKKLFSFNAVACIAIGLLLKVQFDANSNEKEQIKSFHTRYGKLEARVLRIINDVNAKHVTYDELEKASKELIECRVALEMLQADISLAKKRNDNDKRLNIGLAAFSFAISLSSVYGSYTNLTTAAANIHTWLKVANAVTSVVSVVETGLSVKLVLDTFEIGNDLKNIDSKVSDLLDTVKYWQVQTKAQMASAPRIVKTQIDDNKKLKQENKLLKMQLARLQAKTQPMQPMGTMATLNIQKGDINALAPAESDAPFTDFDTDTDPEFFSDTEDDSDSDGNVSDTKSDT